MSDEVNETVEFLKTRGVRIKRRGKVKYFIVPQQAESGHVGKTSISAAASLIAQQIMCDDQSITTVEAALRAMEEEEIIEWKRKGKLKRIASARRAASVKEIAKGIEAWMQTRKVCRAELFVLHDLVLNQKLLDRSLIPRRLRDFESLFRECITELEFAGIDVRRPPTPRFKLVHVPLRIRKQKPK